MHKVLHSTWIRVARTLQVRDGTRTLPVDANALVGFPSVAGQGLHSGAAYDRNCGEPQWRTAMRRRTARQQLTYLCAEVVEEQIQMTFGPTEQLFPTNVALLSHSGSPFPLSISRREHDP